MSEANIEYSKYTLPGQVRRVSSGHCKTAWSHGPATEGKYCATCALDLRRRSRVKQSPEREYYRDLIPTAELVAYLDRREKALASGEVIGETTETVVKLGTVCVTVSQLVRAILAARRTLKAEKASK